jgi:hypothetical protein
METYEKRFVVVNKRTGEVVHSSTRGFYPPAFDEEKGYLFWKGKTFAKQFSDVPFPDGMSDGDVGKLARLAKRIWSNSNVLVSAERGVKKPIGLTEVAGLLGMTERYAGAWMEKLQVLGVLAISEVRFRGNTETFYYVNPVYFFSSNRMPLALYMMFREDLDKHLSAEVRSKFEGQENKKRGAGMSKEDILAETFERGLRGKKEEGCEIDEAV